MFAIVEKDDLAAQVYRYVVYAPAVARKAKAGQFVILRIDEDGERIPITIADWDPLKGTITIFVQAVGKTTIQLSTMHAGDYLADVVGPLGLPSDVEKTGTVVAVGGGFGIAAIHPIIRAHTEIGNRTVSIIGSRTKELLLLEDEMRRVSGEVRIATDDGSYGTKGFVTTVLKQMLDEGEVIDLVVAIGPVPMMKAVSNLTKAFGIRTLVSLNPVMVDGMGMCGACRVLVHNETKFACVDGPEFDAHAVDFELLTSRLRMYHRQEALSLERYRELCRATGVLEKTA